MLGYLWGWFCEIIGGVGLNGFGPSTITWADLTAWSALIGETLEPWESRCLVNLSLLRANVLNADAEAKGVNPNQD